MRLIPSKNQIFDNEYFLREPENGILLPVNESRFNWYINRNLGKVEGNSNILLLNFKPKWATSFSSQEDFLLSKRENKCVVCGNEKDLTRHHVVPKCFMKFLYKKFLVGSTKNEFRMRVTYDLQPLCVLCHEQYEKHADKLKNDLRAKYELTEYGNLLKAYGAAITLKNYGDTIPESRKEELRSEITAFFGRSFSQDMIENLVSLKSEDRHWAKKVLDGYENIDDFMILWRRHFWATMSPRFCRESWQLDRRIIEEMLGAKER